MNFSSLSRLLCLGAAACFFSALTGCALITGDDGRYKPAALTTYPAGLSVQVGWKAQIGSGSGIGFAPAVVDTLWAYRWSFGDGNLSTQVSPAHTYASGGMYTVRLVVTRLSTTAGAACSDTESRVVNVPMPPRPPISNPWSIPCNPRFGARVDTTLTVQFRSVMQDTTAQYSWNFGNGSTSSVRNPSHTYGSAGSYVVVLAVSRPGTTPGTSCADTAWLRISVPGYRRPRIITNPRPVPPPSSCQAH